MELIVNLSVILFFIGLWMYARYWRRMCGKAFCQYAAACCGREEREKLMRYAIIAGNRHAPLLYALTYPERFDKVYDFKEGRDPCRNCFSQAFRVLSVTGDVTAMFMPCSTSRRYHRRFSGIAAFLESGGYAQSGLDLICITEDRESKHTSGRRSGVDTANYMMARGLRGKRVVIVDDLLTSGDSLLEYAHNLERVGAIVTGAVFLARTFRMPPPATVRRVVWKHHLSALLTGK